MSQRYVEHIIGRLATDEALRREFEADPDATLRELVERGMELTPGECWSLACLDTEELARFAGAIDARLQKADLKKGKP